MSTINYVYVIAAGDITNDSCVFKIGVSENPTTRRTALQTANFYPLNVMMTVKFSSLSASLEFETLAQNSLFEDSFERRGEWFRGNLVTACRLLKRLYSVSSFDDSGTFLMPVRIYSTWLFNEVNANG